jgi:rhodanese-related sulfurtransferase
MPTRITPAELAPLLRRDPTSRLLDVRTPGEFETVHIPGSYNVPLDDLAEHGATIAAIDEPVVLVCRTGGRATKAESTLAGLGMGNLMVLDGGIAAWDQHGLPVRRGAAPRWSLERQVRLAAGAMVLVAILLSVVVAEAKWIAGFVGAGLTFAALTDTCAMGMLLAKLPYNRAVGSCDTETMVARLRGGLQPTP